MEDIVGTYLAVHMHTLNFFPQAPILSHYASEYTVKQLPIAIYEEQYFIVTTQFMTKATRNQKTHRNQRELLGGMPYTIYSY